MKVGGSGSNKFGTFTLHGEFNPLTMELNCDRSYLTRGTKIHPLALIALNMSSSFNSGPRGRPRAPPTESISFDDSRDPNGNMRTRKKLLSWQEGGQKWATFEDYDNVPQQKSRKTSSNPRPSMPMSKKPCLPEDLYGPYNPGPVSKNVASTKTNANPLPKLQKSKLRAPALPDPKLCRWRSAFFFDPPVNKEVYEGEMLNNMRDGQGVFVYRNGNMYEGAWKKNYEHGYGVLFNKKRQVIYSGEFDKGKLTGRGTYNFLDGGVYVGEWRENLRHGAGEYRFPDGAVYIGDWKEDKFWGKGKFWWPSLEGEKDSSYDGDWQNSVRHGKGHLILSNGFEYQGLWSHDMIEGKGSLTYPDGQKFHGQFVCGRRHGRGTVAFENGATYEGRFRDDEIIGGGTFSLPNVAMSSVRGQKEYLIPINIADIEHVHQKAGFTSFGC